MKYLLLYVVVCYTVYLLLYINILYTVYIDHGYYLDSRKREF